MNENTSVPPLWKGAHDGQVLSVFVSVAHSLDLTTDFGVKFQYF